MAKTTASGLTADERRFLAYAIVALVESAPVERQAEIQTDASIIATKLGIVRELSEGISRQQARDAQTNTPGSEG